MAKLSKQIATVIAGDYTGWTISGLGFGDLVLCKPFSLREKITLNKGTVESCDAVSSSAETKGGGLGKAIVGGAFFGVAGAIVGGRSRTVTTAVYDIKMKSGESFRLETKSPDIISKLNALGF